MYSHPGVYRHPRGPRLLGWLFTIILLIVLLGWLAPDQLPVIMYKLVLVILGAVQAYWIDRALFPYARPHFCAADSWPRTMAMIRRALIVLACVLGLTLGL